MKNIKKTSSRHSVPQTGSESIINLRHSELVSESTNVIDTEINSAGQKSVISNEVRNLLKIISSLFSLNPKTKNSKLKTTFGFTLVELIVVITILSILGTISFISFGGYSSQARDSSRVADLSNISKGLVVQYTISGKYPIPDNYITLTASGTPIGYQGYVGDKTKTIIKMSNGGIDPLDQISYTYNVNSDQSKIQLLGFLENSDNITLSQNISILDKVNADSLNYSQRFIITNGDNIGILLASGTYVPIQSNTGVISIDLKYINQVNIDYIAYIDKNTILEGTGTMLGGISGFYNSKTSSSKYPGCDTNDILLPNGDIWATCNVGASIAYNGQDTNITNTGTDGGPTEEQKKYMGAFFQWGRNDDISGISSIYSGQISESEVNIYKNNFIKSAIATDWLVDTNSNLWGGSGTTSTGGAYIDRSDTDKILMKGPCAYGYHIPTVFEFSNSLKSSNPNLIIGETITTFQNDSSFQKILKLPFGGIRKYDGIYDYFSQTYFWTSSQRTDNSWGGFAATFKSNGYRFVVSGQKGNGMPIRCKKN